MTNELTTNESKTNEFMLTTVDNPFDPFDQFDSWLLFDKEKGYDSCEKLARIVKITNDMSQKEIEEETYRAIDQIIKEDFLDIFCRAYPKGSNEQ